MYDELVKRLRETPSDWPDAELHYEAANAIENTSKAYQMMAEAYESEVTKPCWIPVTERLPEEGKYVLVYGEELHPNPHASQIEVSKVYDVNYWSGLGRTGKITHWMPLPEPPKEET